MFTLWHDTLKSYLSFLISINLLDPIFTKKMLQNEGKVDVDTNCVLQFIAKCGRKLQDEIINQFKNKEDSADSAAAKIKVQVYLTHFFCTGLFYLFGHQLQFKNNTLQRHKFFIHYSFSQLELQNKIKYLIIGNKYRFGFDKHGV